MSRADFNKKDANKKGKPAKQHLMQVFDEWKRTKIITDYANMGSYFKVKDEKGIHYVVCEWKSKRQALKWKFDGVRFIPDKVKRLLRLGHPAYYYMVIENYRIYYADAKKIMKFKTDERVDTYRKDNELFYNLDLSRVSWYDINYFDKVDEGENLFEMLTNKGD